MSGPRSHGPAPIARGGAAPLAFGTCYIGRRSRFPRNEQGDLINELDHTSYRDLGHHIERIIANGRVSAADLFAQGRRASWSDLALRPAFRFWRDYLLHGSIFDGRVGVIHAGMSAASVFFKYAFLWERQRGSGG